MRIHAATDNDIHPPRFGGPQRAFGLARGLARRHAVTVLCLVPNRDPAPREQTVEGVTLIRRKAWYTSLAWRLDRLGVAPLFVAGEGHAANARRLARELPGGADALLADLALASLLDVARATLKVHTSHNVEADHWAGEAARFRDGARWQARLRALEARTVARADLTVVCSDEDAERMRALHGADPARLHVAPNGYDETGVRPPDGAERERARQQLGCAPDEVVGLFVGSDVPHNREAARFLVERVGPALAGAGVRIVIAGAVTRGLAPPREPWLTALAETPDIAPVLHAADVGLNPVAGGGGSNVKIPTYLAAGLAVVSTPFGMRGYPSLAPWVQVVERDQTAAALREAPRGWHARGLPLPAEIAGHAWGAIGARLGDALEALLAGRAGAPAAERRAGA